MRDQTWLAGVALSITVCACSGGSTSTAPAASSQASPAESVAPASTVEATTIPEAAVPTSTVPPPFAVLSHEPAQTVPVRLDRVDPSLAILPAAIEFGWQIDAPAGVFVSAISVGAVVVVSTIGADETTQITAYSAETGAVAWRHSIAAERTVSLLAVGDALIVELAEREVGATLSRLEPTDGSTLWEVPSNDRGGIWNRYGSLVQFDSEGQRLNVFDLATGEVSIELDPYLAANAGFVVRDDDTAQAVDFQTLEPVGAVVVIPDLHDSTRTLGVIVGERFVQYIDKSLVFFDVGGDEIGRTEEILHADGVQPVPFSNSLVNFLGQSIDVSGEPRITWLHSRQPQVLGVSGERVIAVEASLPPEGGSRSVVVDLQGGSEVCELETSESAQLFGNGFFADATAFDLSCSPLWTIDLPSEQMVIALENGALVVGTESIPDSWYFYRS